MAKIEDLISEIADARLRQEISREVSVLKKQKKFGLVFEEHIPETVQVPSLPVRPGVHVAKRDAGNKEVFLVEAVVGNGEAHIRRDNSNATEETVSVKELVVVKRFGDPIYPTLIPVEKLTRVAGKPYHTIINADNYHALELLLYCYAGQVDVIYIDPPYNTGARNWKYNNDYVDANDQWRHSKWLSMMKRRLLLAKKLLKRDGILCITIDDYEVHRLRSMIEDHLQGTVLGTLVIKNNPAGRSTVKGVSIAHEYAMLVAFSEAAEVSRLERSDDQIARYSEQDTKGSFEWVNFRKHGGANALRPARPKLYYPIYATEATWRIPKIQWDKSKREWIPLEKPKKHETVIFPINKAGEQRTWKWGHETASQNPEELMVKRDSQDKIGIYMKSRMNVEGLLPITFWDKPAYSATDYGTNLVRNIFGESEKFPFPKSLYAVLDCLKVSGADKKDALILDFFAGSGTTYHATALLNSVDGGSRRCILITNNEVNEKLGRELTEKGIYPGNSKFELHGICESATWPRCKYVTQGHRDDKTPLPGTYLNEREMKEGFDENIEYFRLEFLDPHEVAYGEKFEAILPILWLMAGGKGEQETARGYGKWFIPKSSPFAVLIKEDAFGEFKRELKNHSDITFVFLVTDSEEAYREMAADLPGRPQTKMLYKSYLDNFRINTEKSL